MSPSKSAPADATVSPQTPAAAMPAPAVSASGAVRPRRRVAVKAANAAVQVAAPVKPAKPAKKAKAIKAAQGAQVAQSVPARKDDKAVKPAMQPAKPLKANKPAKAEKPEKVEKAEKAPKASKRPQPLVRDSFTMPADDFALVGTLKARALAAQHVAKKSELLRAGLHALQAMSADQLLATLRALQPIKLGRPKK